jgi:hypothetical protein
LFCSNCNSVSKPCKAPKSVAASIAILLG